MGRVVGASQNLFLIYDYTLNHNGTELPFGLAAGRIQDRRPHPPATDFVTTSAARAQPFYLQLWYTAPHVEEGTD